ncbi:MAG: type IV toxin-antitoxin system AbiEi family antitoxin domain-containing protein, partial [Longimicrobiales bacterium]
MAPHTDHLIANLAAHQLGLVTRAQLLQRGVSGDSVDSRVRAGRLRPIHRGVYLVGPLVVPRMRELAAVLACGPRAFVSHGSAALLWQLLPDAVES